MPQILNTAWSATYSEWFDHKIKNMSGEKEVDLFAAMKPWTLIDRNSIFRAFTITKIPIQIFFCLFYQLIDVFAKPCGMLFHTQTPSECLPAGGFRSIYLNLSQRIIAPSELSDFYRQYFCVWKGLGIDMQMECHMRPATIAQLNLL